MLNSLQAIHIRRIKSNPIKEKIMLSMRACQDIANVQFFLFILYINNFPFKYTLQKQNKKEEETQHVKKYNLLQIFNILLNTEISITLL